jgi:hypothetical protein
MTWLSSAIDWVSGNSDTLGGIASLIGAGTSLYSGISAANSADDLAGLAENNAALQAALAARSQEIGDAAGDDLEAALTAFLGNTGNSGFFNPGRISDLSSGFMDEITNDRRSIERGRDLTMTGANAGAYDNMSEIMGIAGGMGLPGTAGESLRGVDGGLPWGPDVSIFLEAAGMDPYQVAEMVTGQPQFDLQADPSDFYGDVSGLANEIYASLGDGTDRAIQAVLGEQAADAERRGMERSSYDIATKRMAADFAAERYAADKDRAVDKAFEIIGGYSDLAEQKQAGEIRELSSILGQDEMSLAARGMDFNELMGSIGMGTELLGAGKSMAWGDRSSALQEIAGIRGLAGSDSFDATNMALGLEGGIQGLRQGTLNEIISSVVTPYQVRSTGAKEAAAPLYGAGGQYTDLAKSYAGAAGSAGEAAATWFDQANKWWS